MIACSGRMNPYARALRSAVHPGCVVVDIGAGTGIFSLLSCRYGADEVHAIEPDSCIGLAHNLAVVNGFVDRICFHQGLSTSISLPRRADVIVSDLRGALPLFQHHIGSIADARERLLRPGGILIPTRDRLWAALIEAPETYRSYREPLLSNQYDLNLTPGRSLVVNTWRKVNAKVTQLLVDPALWATLDYATVTSPDVTGGLSWTLPRPGTAHGLLVWFDAELAEGIGFSNRPGEPELIYGQAFFPLEAPLELEQGDQVQVTLSANMVGDDYLWRWDTCASRDNAPMANYRQSTFYATPLSSETLQRRAADYVPTATTATAIDRFVLSHLDGVTSLGTLADALMGQFPDRFSHYREALSYCADLAERYRPANP